MKNRIGVFGSALNPPTNGHVDAIEQALCFVDQVLVVPSYSHAFGKEMKPFNVRVNLAKAAFEQFGDRVIVSDIERSLYKGGPVYTCDLLSEIQKIHSDSIIAFICGPDNLLGFSHFKNSADVLERFQILSVTERKAVRSTLVRSNIQNGKRINNLVPQSIIKTVQDVYNEKTT
ncbi:Nicotinate-nucleotide adenylyltransferase [Vibrio chagasii]|nr:Nicotinate-nucleotide adenylyltransferase [Vibrio chagasii]